MSASKRTAAVGVADHAGWAVLVTATPDGTVLDRRRVELVDDALPKLPHHHEAQALPLGDAETLIATVRASADQHAAACLVALAEDVPADISGIAIRACPSLPETVAERIADYRAQCVADTAMYRHAVRDAAAARGWRVRWYDAKRIFAEAAKTLRRETVDDLLAETGKALGPPWQKDHRMAMASAITAAAEALPR